MVEFLSSVSRMAQSLFGQSAKNGEKNFGFGENSNGGNVRYSGERQNMNYTAWDSER